MSWITPIDYMLEITSDDQSFKNMPDGFTGLPINDHPGAFSTVRKFDVHTGVDLYVPDKTPVRSVEAGKVVCIIPFTGEIAGLPWWNDTYAVLIEGESGVVLYGEIIPATLPGQLIAAGEIVGHVTKVLKIDKGRPMSMLHLELHSIGSRTAPTWVLLENKPNFLLDPTEFLENSTLYNRK